jgi:hypothetical protein
MANRISATVYEAESIGVKFAVQCFCEETHILQLQKEEKIAVPKGLQNSEITKQMGFSVVKNASS